MISKRRIIVAVSAVMACTVALCLLGTALGAPDWVLLVGVFILSGGMTATWPLEETKGTNGPQDR